MVLWILIQTVINLALALGLVVMWLRLKRPPKDDPRLSRGLQLLQSKISVLEDLSDRTDVQVKQLSTLLDQKARQLQNKVFEAERQIQKVEQSMHKSMEVAEIFQDRIPHKEIIERQNTIRYVKAARMAYEGCSVEEISEEVDLPREQLEFIAKVNRDQLMFDENMLPEWAKRENIDASAERLEFELENHRMIEDEEADDLGHTPGIEDLFESKGEDFSSLRKLGDQFRSACRQFEEQTKVYEPEQEKAEESEQRGEREPNRMVEAARQVTQKMTQKMLSSAADFLNPLEEEFKEPVPEPESKPEVAPRAPVNASQSFALKKEEPAPEVPPAPATKTHIVRADAKKGTGSQPDTIRKVQFPRIDMTDNLG